MEVVIVETDNIYLTFQHENNSGCSTAQSSDLSISSKVDSADAPEVFRKWLQRLDLQNPNFRWNACVRVEVGVSLSRDYQSLADGNRDGIIRVQDSYPRADCNFLKELCETFGYRMKLRLDLLDIENGSDKAESSLSGKGVIRQLESKKYGMETHTVKFQDNFYHFKKYGMFCCKVKLTAILSQDILPSIDSITDDQLFVNKKILKDDIGSDLIIIPNNQVRIKCHKAILMVHSELFAKMIRASKNSTVQIHEMTEEAVRALLAFLYCWDIKGPMESSSICYELFRASLEYDIPKLQGPMKKILLGKDIKWFDAEVGLKLFAYARTIAEGDKLKTKAMEILSSNAVKLREMPSYQQLFRDPEAAQELHLHLKLI